MPEAAAPAAFADPMRFATTADNIAGAMPTAD